MDVSDRRTHKRNRSGFAVKFVFGLGAICAVTVGWVLAATAASANRNRDALFGESGVEESVYAQVAARLAADLFLPAISESGACAFPDLAALAYDCRMQNWQAPHELLGRIPFPTRLHSAGAR